MAKKRVTLREVAQTAGVHISTVSRALDPNTRHLINSEIVSRIVKISQELDYRTLAINHCASYGKVVKFLAVDAHYGGYISFACRWVPYRAALRTYY